jgi:hypothetical protein
MLKVGVVVVGAGRGEACGEDIIVEYNFGF